jgi:divalent metal cation (Fe/Co/Zn/Cd) transporter
VGVTASRFVDFSSAARRGRQLELLTILWGTCEASGALAAALRGHSISLAGFWLDSVIEVVSASALMWRMSQEMDHHKRHQAEHISLRIAGICLLVLALYVAADSVWSLVKHQSSRPTWLGIAVAAAALVCMPLLARAKKHVANALDSNAMMSDARQTDFCSYQAFIVLLGIGLQRTLGWGWADGVAGLLLVPIIIRAGVLSLQGKNCCVHH